MKPRIAVHKFSSCDGCQLALLNMGEALLDLAALVEVVHFAEAGYVDEEAEVDIAFVEGSVSTPAELERIKSIRERSGLLITIGACATSGGLQALRNMNDSAEWVSGVYASPQHISLLETSTAISDHVKVDLQIWGCPVNTRQVARAVRDLLFGVTPAGEPDRVCNECKRLGHTCVVVTQGEPCLGPVTIGGCGALCPGLGRACYGCYGPSYQPNAASLAQHFQALGLDARDISRRFQLIHSQADPFAEEAGNWQEQAHE